MVRVEPISAKEARAMCGADTMQTKILNSIYKRIRNAAANGKREIEVDFGAYSGSLRSMTIFELSRQGYRVIGERFGSKVKVSW